jgi:hypothetical protein
MKYELNLHKRFALVNFIGDLISTKVNFKKSIELVEKLGITKNEAEDPNLQLVYNEQDNTFKYNEDYDKIIEIDSDEIPSELIEYVERLINA